MKQIGTQYAENLTGIRGLYRAGLISYFAYYKAIIIRLKMARDKQNGKLKRTAVKNHRFESRL